MSIQQWGQSQKGKDTAIWWIQWYGLSFVQFFSEHHNQSEETV
jgi:hypothetical protein